MSEAIFPGSTPTLVFTFPEEIVPAECKKITLILTQGHKQVVKFSVVPDAETGEVHLIDTFGPYLPVSDGAGDGAIVVGHIRTGIGDSEIPELQEFDDQTDPSIIEQREERIIIDGQEVSVKLFQVETAALDPFSAIALELWVRTGSNTVPDPWQTSIPVGFVFDSGAV